MMIGVMRKKKKRDVREEEEGIFKVKMDKKMWLRVESFPKDVASLNLNQWILRILVLIMHTLEVMEQHQMLIKIKVAEEGLLKINLREKTSVLGMLLILLNRRKKIWRIYIWSKTLKFLWIFLENLKKKLRNKMMNFQMF